MGLPDRLNSLSKSSLTTHLVPIVVLAAFFWFSASSDILSLHAPRLQAGTHAGSVRLMS
jgi:hypothetical protein